METVKDEQIGSTFTTLRPTSTTAYYSLFTGQNRFDSILSGYQWGQSVTYSFALTNSSWTGYPAGSEPFSGFQPLNATQQSAVQTILQMYSEIANIQFTLVTEPGQEGTIRFGQSSDPTTSWAYYPHPSESGGDVWLGTGQYAPDNPIKGNYDYLTLIHEIGHALGLKHPHEGTDQSTTIADSFYDRMDYSVMSYRSYTNGQLYYVNGSNSFAQTLMMNDIAAMQFLYGANYTTRSGNDTYKFLPTQGKIYETIWDGGGIDTYDLTAYSTDLKLDLRAGQWSTFSTSQLADLNAAELGTDIYATGNVANALLYNNDIRSLIENAYGGSGNDSITGNEANNILQGGAGNDSLAAGLGNDSLYGGTGNDTLGGSGGNDRIDGGDGDDLIYFDVNDIVIIGGTGIDTLYAGNYMSTNALDLALTNFLDIENVIGGAGNDIVKGNSLNNWVLGGAGNDTLSGAAGDDSLDGGDGDDFIYYDINDLGIKGGNGNDTLYAGNYPDYRNIDVNLVNYADIENVTGGAGNDVVKGNSLNNWVLGNAGNDTLSGAAGDDSLDGGDGDDFIYYDINDRGIKGGNGNDTLYAGNYPDYRNIDVNLVNYADIENVTGGAGNDIVKGNSLNNWVLGNAGNDTLSGAAGDDSLDGGDGDDFIYYDTNDRGIKGGNGNDTLYAGNYPDYRNIDVNLVNYADIENVTGGAGNDIVKGNSLNNWVLGNGGNDTLSGAAGDDSLDGGDGDDFIYYDINDRGIKGGTGNDTLYAGNYLSSKSINVDLGLYNDIEVVVGGAGNDTLTSNSLNNVFTGGAGNDIYIFEADFGQDIITKDAGNGGDVVYFGNSIFEILNGDAEPSRDGNDLVFSIDVPETGSTGDMLRIKDWFVDSVDQKITQFAFGDSELLTIHNILFDSSDTANTLYGSSLNDAFLDKGGNDTYYGLAGDDLIFGIEGDDAIYGGDGNDQLGDDAGSNFIDGGEGNDWITFDSSDVVFSMALGGNGDDVFEMWGGRDNSFYGGAGNDEFYIEGGMDTILNGGTGNDKYSLGRFFNSVRITAEDTNNLDIVEFLSFSSSQTSVHLGGVGGDDLIVDASGYGTLIIEDWNQGDGKKLNSFVFSDGVKTTAGNGWV